MARGYPGEDEEEGCDQKKSTSREDEEDVRHTKNDQERPSATKSGQESVVR